MVTTEKKLDDIFNSLIPDLLKSATIDKKYNILKPQVFLDIVEQKEKEINKLLALTEENGSTVDRNAANRIYSVLQILSDMKEKMSVKPYEPEFEKKEEKSKKASAFKIGLFSVFKRKKSAQKTSSQYIR